MEEISTFKVKNCLDAKWRSIYLIKMATFIYKINQDLHNKIDYIGFRQFSILRSATSSRCFCLAPGRKNQTKFRKFETPYPGGGGGGGGGCRVEICPNGERVGVSLICLKG